ncbi:glycosyltransferase [Dactylosporangium sp. NPDC050588]|uniref:glycosyltransferase n=1 Tax=Dactylosporangium sp. NPDC050588 TaxID=3157211 RepID=UPI0033E8742B
MEDETSAGGAATLTAAPAHVSTPAGAGLRVCIVIGQLGLGGTEKQIVMLADGLQRRGSDVTVVVLTGEGPRSAALREAGVRTVYLGWTPRPGWRAVLCLLATFARLTRFLRETRPGLVHAFLFHSYVMAAPAARIARVPVVIAGRRSLDDFKQGRRLALLTERIATRMTHLLVANAYAVADCVRRTEKVTTTKIKVIYNGLPDEAFADARPAHIRSKRPVVLCVANFKRYKGHDHLLEAGRLLSDRGTPCTFVFAGGGEQRRALIRQATRLGVDLRMLGPRTDVDRLLARADAVVLPSLTEGMSNAVMEAMAAGRPVIATAVGGSPELLANGRGLLVPPRDPAGLADAIAGVLADPGRAQAMGRAARQWSRIHLHGDTMVDQHVDLYRGMLAAAQVRR